MPLQNRVAPTGEIIATPARGLLMGNRGGRLHTAERTLSARRWASRQWIICVLAFKDRHRQVMGAGYTELFFLDEVTALAAGHRPCFECQRARALDYAHRFPGEGRSRAPAMDRILHEQRLGARAIALPCQLPEGAMFLHAGRPYALRGGAALPWAPEGYGPPRPLPETRCDVLTPVATCTALSAGYAPVWHPSAGPGG